MAKSALTQPLDVFHTRLLFVSVLFSLFSNLFIFKLVFDTEHLVNHSVALLRRPPSAPLILPVRLCIYNINRFLYDMLIKFECKLSRVEAGTNVCFFILSFVGIFSHIWSLCFLYFSVSSFRNRGNEKATEILRSKLKIRCEIVKLLLVYFYGLVARRVRVWKFVSDAAAVVVVVSGYPEQ